MNARRMSLAGPMSLCALVALLALGSAPALAAEEHPYLPSRSLSDVFAESTSSSGLATDSDGDVYVSEYNEDKVTVYSPAGALITAFSPTAPKGFGPAGLAVDSSGDVYVQVYNRSVTKYKPSAFPPTASTKYEVDKSAGTEGVIVPNTGEAHAVAIDPANQDVYVAEAKHIASYTPTGSLLSATVGEKAVSSPEYFGVDVYGANGDVYAIDRAHASAYVLNPSGTEVLAKTKFTASSSPNLYDLAVDQSNGAFFVLSSQPENESATSVVDEFSTSGAYVSKLPKEFGGSLKLEGIRGPDDIAVDNGESSPNAGDVFVASRDQAHHADSVYAFGPLTASPKEKLTVAKGGNGAGKLVCEVNGAFEECASEYPEGTEMTLRGSAETGSVFAGWNGGSGSAAGCSGTTGCTFALSAGSALDATFLLEGTLAVETQGAGGGSVASEPAGIECPLTCEAVLGKGAAVTLTATPQAGSEVRGWTGCTSVSGPAGEQCAVTIATAKLVTVEFAVEPVLTVTKEGTGSSRGQVASAPAGIECGSECSHPFADGRTVVLEERGEGATFDGWEGCSAEVSGKCEVVVSEAKTVKARFTAAVLSKFPLEVVATGDGEVTSEAGTLACEAGGSAGQCSEEVEETKTARLKAKAPLGWRVQEWSAGPCAGTHSEMCEFAMPNHKVAVSIVFAASREQSLGVVKYGEGEVRSTVPTGLTCGLAQDECSAEFEAGANVVLEEIPAAGYQFSGWIGCKHKTATTCEVQVAAGSEVGAVFLRTGTQGSQGPQGPSGSQGSQGMQGPSGQPGSEGHEGAPGTSGARGERGAPGAQGTAGPPGAQGAAGPAGTVELVTCNTVKRRGGRRAQKCSTKLVQGAVTFTTTTSSLAIRATLSRHGAVYATGIAQRGVRGHLRLRLQPLRRLRPGVYTLTLIGGSGAHQWIDSETFMLSAPKGGGR